MTRKNRRVQNRRVRGMLLIGAVLSVPALASAQSAGVAVAPASQTAAATPASAVKAFDISAQPLSKALLEFSKQADLIVTVSPALVQGRNAPAIRGELEPMTALSKLLQGTGLQVSRSPGGGITIVSTATSMSAVAAPPMQLAQSPANVVQEANASAGTAVAEAASEPATAKGIPEMLVKGAKFSVNADIQRTEDDIQPYVVYTAEEIQSSMASNLEDFFKLRLPMAKILRSVNGTGTNSQSKTSGNNQSSINLRGLGVDETLILVNGRRMPGVSAVFDSDTDAQGAFNQVDLNGIPLSQVERIEILPSTASGIYGGGATGGVVNIILKNEYSGFQTTVNYANVFDTDAGDIRFTGNGGFSLEGGRTGITYSASYSQSNALMGRDRDFTVNARRKAVANSPEQYTGPFAQIPVSYTTNIKSAQYNSALSTYDNLVLDDGTPLGSTSTYVPIGYTGVGSDNGQALVRNAGQFNLDLSDDLNGNGRSQNNNPKTWSARLGVNREFNEYLTAYTDLSYTMNNGRVYFAQMQNQVYNIPASSPSNPFQQAINATFPLPGLAFLSTNESETVNGVVGATIRLPHRWNASVEYGRGRSNSESVGGSAFRDNDVTTALRNGTLNVIRDLNLQPLDLSAYALDYPSGGNLTRGYMADMVLRASGPVLQLPGGAITLSGSINRNKNTSPKALLRGYQSFLNGYFWVYQPERWSEATSAYLETFVPLVSESNARPGLKVLELQASMRRDDYTIRQGRVPDVMGPFGPQPGNQLSNPDPLPAVEYTTSGVASNGYTVGFRYGPVEDLILRASYSYGFKPPSAGQISPSVNQNVNVYDPTIGQYGTQYVVPMVIRGGNPDVQPETSDSISVGAILRPRALPGLRLSVDYTHIKKTDEIASIYDGLIIQNADLFPGRVVRGSDGFVDYLDASMLNIDYGLVEAYDVQADYEFSTSHGDFNVYAVATHNTRFSRRLIAGESIEQYIGYRDGPLDWTGNIGLTWHKDAWRLGWNMQWYNDYLVYPAGDADSPGQIAYLTQMQGSDTIPAQHYHDISFRYRFGEAPGFAGRALANVEISGGIQNVFNTRPPDFLVSGDMGYSAYGDPRMRRYTLQLIKGF